MTEQGLDKYDLYQLIRAIVEGRRIGIKIMRAAFGQSYMHPGHICRYCHGKGVVGYRLGDSR